MLPVTTLFFYWPFVVHLITVHSPAFFLMKKKSVCAPEIAFRFIETFSIQYLWPVPYLRRPEMGMSKGEIRNIQHSLF
jgi:hypothetical protein